MFPTDLNSLLAIIAEHGSAAYMFMFSYATSHSLLLAMFAGYAAYSGALSVGTLILVCWAGSFVGDVVRFWLGRKYGTRWLGNSTRFQRAIQTVMHLASRHHIWMIMLHRYPHGIRGIAGLAYGMTPMSWSSFLTLNAIAAGVWSCIVVMAGYAFGQVSEKAMTDASSHLGLAMLVIFLGLSWFLSKRLERAMEQS
jgi:membrane protein DedA with SNARE-associated domain